MPHLAGAQRVETVVITILDASAETMGAIGGMTAGSVELCKAYEHLGVVVHHSGMKALTVDVLVVRFGCVVVELIDGKYIYLAISFIVEQKAQSIGRVSFNTGRNA